MRESDLVASFTESFNTADSDILGPDNTWTEVSGDWDIVSNEAELQTTGANSTARCETTLDSNNHSVTATMGDIGDTNCGVVLRFSSSAETGYIVYWVISTTRLVVGKVVAGTFSEIGDSGVISPGAITTIKGEVIGTTIRGYINGTLYVTQTNSDITTGSLVGIYGQASSSPLPAFDSISASVAGSGVMKLVGGSLVRA